MELAKSSPPSIVPPTPSTKTRKRSSSFLAADSPQISTITNVPTSPPRRCSRRLSISSDNPKPTSGVVQTLEPSPAKTPKSRKLSANSKTQIGEKLNGLTITPKSPDLSDRRKRTEVKESKGLKVRAGKSSRNVTREKVYYKRVAFDGSEFEVGDDVYVKRRDDASSDEELPEVDECRVCFRAGKTVMIECDECLGGFHLKCLKPPLKKVPEGNWVCQFCEMKKLGKTVQLPSPPKGKKRIRTLREKLLSGDLWAARIDSIWKGTDGIFWFRAHWYVIPEETSAGRQPHNLRRELYQTNDFADAEMETIIRHCYVMSPREFAKANEGDDVFFCEYEYDICWHTFKRVSENGEDDEVEKKDDDLDWDSCEDLESSDEEYDMEVEQDRLKREAFVHPSREVAVNSRRGWIFGLQKIGTKKIPQHVRCHTKTEIEKAKQSLVLSTLPKHLPCRKIEMEEISAFVKGAISNDQCLGRCLYIHGVPGTGKTMSVVSVMKSLKSEVEAGSVKPYCFVEINGLKLSSPENIYKVIYEALSGHRVPWKKALNLLNERFSEGNKISKLENKPCILLIDELDVLVTRNQAVLYNLLDWPNKPNSKLVVIGIANTMDLPEKLLPRISSRMGIHRICFGPYNYHQLQEIILSRLTGINAFENQAVEFAARKVAAISGDARRALEICRRAVEIADYNFKTQSNMHSASVGILKIGMTEVEGAIQEMFQAPHIQVMKASSKFSKIFLTAMVQELYVTGVAETTFEKVASRISCFCVSNGEIFPGWDTLLRVGCKLGETRIILCESGSKHRLQKLQLNFPNDDVAFALKDCKDVPWLAKYL